MSPSYLRFELDLRTSAGRKSQVWNVLGVRDGSTLGVVRWFGRWRQYTFFPTAQTAFNPDCLEEISAFMREKTREQLDAARRRVT